MDPVLPMEPKLSQTIPQSPEWIAQVKWDGVRQLVYNDGQQVRIFNRRLHERTSHYPELVDLSTYCKANSAILDGEVIALGADGKPDFHQVMRRDGLRRLEKVGQVRKSVPIIYMVFDVLFFNGEWVTTWSLRDRLHLLATCITPGPCVQLVSTHTNAEAVLHAVKAQGMEGVVLKKKNSLYHIGQKTEDWLKVKNYLDLVAVIGGYTLNGGTINALLLGLYDDANSLHYIGHGGTGRLSQQDWRNLTNLLMSLSTAECPFVSLPTRTYGAKWVTPRITVRIQYFEWQKGRSIRQPSIHAVVNQPALNCRFERAMMRD